MMSKKNRTRQQMEEEMRQLRKVFMTVRLMKADEVQGGKKGSAPCYAQWRRSRPCENCVARQALEKNTRKTRLEYFGQELYEITASCVQVDGQLCVLELTRKIDRSVLLDPENGERLLNSITDEREKRYRDPLTGAYNRTYYDENYRYRSITAGVAMLDMDDLKFSNDVYGSGAGNSVLETAVSTIRRGLSEKDRLIRYDGGRLLLLLPDIRQEQLSPRLEQIRLQLQAASVPGYSRIRMSASIGGVWIDDENVDDAVQHAERLMHYARIQKNTVITERQPEPHALQPTHSRQSVLIVDDSAMNRMLLSQMLNSQFDTAEAASGEDCLRLLEQNPTGISVVLLDIHMTGIDGFTVLEAMSQRGMLEEIPVIMISSEDNVDTVRRAFDLGASDYISRPFDARVVYQRITICKAAPPERHGGGSGVAKGKAQPNDDRHSEPGGGATQRREPHPCAAHQHPDRNAAGPSGAKDRDLPPDAGDAPYHQHGLGAARHWQNGDRGAGPEQPGAAHAGG